VRPDAIIEVQRRSSPGTRSYLIEYDRTRRVDKNFAKVRRYDNFLCSWWRHTHPADHDDAPFVVFVCEDDTHRDAFLTAADRELTGHLWHPSAGANGHDYAGRDQVLFANEPDMHHGEPIAWRVPQLPPRHPGRHSDEAPRGVRLPATQATTPQA
jgi:hypothetical protein